MKFIKNNDTVNHIWCAIEVEPGNYIEIPFNEEGMWSNDSTLLIDIANSVAIMAKTDDGTTDITDITEGINFLKNNTPSEVVVTDQAEPPPYARPDFRTKLNATASLVTVAPNSSEDIDFLLTEERYVSGGTLIVKNAELGDYVECEIVDTLGLIPEPYRAVLCEAWPIVATYVVKNWVCVADSGTITKHIIDTRPLNAKITQGLSLRLKYFATSEGNSRVVGINYDLTTKLV